MVYGGFGRTNALEGDNKKENRNQERENSYNWCDVLWRERESESFSCEKELILIIITEMGLSTL